MLTENHDHQHIHEPMVHNHRHSHPDEHHIHDSRRVVPLVNGSHTHHIVMSRWNMNTRMPRICITGTSTKPNTEQEDHRIMQ